MFFESIKSIILFVWIICLVFAFLYNVTLIPVAAGLLYPSLGWRIDPSLAGLAMALSSVSVVINSARLSHRPLLATSYPE